MRITLPHTLVAFALASLSLTTATQAAFTVIDNFESYAIGAAPTAAIGSTWTAGSNGADFVVVADPTGATNQVLDRPSGSSHGVLFNSVPEVAAGQTGTLFFRVLTGGPIYGSMDLKLGLAPASASATDMDLGYAAGVSTGDQAGRLFGYPNGGGEPTLSQGAWYDVWVVADHSANKYSVLASGPGLTGQTALVSNATAGETGADWSQLKIGIWEGRSTALDDFYFASGTDLSNPTTAATVPEPASLGLLAAAGLIALRRRA